MNRISRYTCVLVISLMSAAPQVIAKSNLEILATSVLINTISHIMIDNFIHASTIGFLVQNSYDTVTFHVPFIECLPDDMQGERKKVINHGLKAFAANIFGQSVGSLLGNKLRPFVTRLVSGTASSKGDVKFDVPAQHSVDHVETPKILLQEPIVVSEPEPGRDLLAMAVLDNIVGHNQEELVENR